jgi:hypothetical protein
MDTQDEQVVNSMFSSESPQSANVVYYDRGFRVQVTVRDPNVIVQPLMAKMKLFVDHFVESGFKPSWNDDTNKKTNGEPALKCETCGAPAEKRSGVGKTGKPWTGTFCSANKEHVRWG